MVNVAKIWNAPKFWRLAAWRFVSRCVFFCWNHTSERSHPVGLGFPDQRSKCGANCSKQLGSCFFFTTFAPGGGWVPKQSMGLVYLPTFTIKNQPHVGKYTLNLPYICINLIPTNRGSSTSKIHRFTGFLSANSHAYTYLGGTRTTRSRHASSDSTTCNHSGRLQGRWENP